MTVRHEAAPDRATGTRGETGNRLETIGAWVLGILGAVCAFMGLFILFAGEEQSVGIGGDLSWKVGEIPMAWPYGLLIGGVVLLLAAVLLYRMGVNAARTGGQVASHALTDLVLHGIAFAFVNAFLWLQDIATGGGLDYAYWVTIPWGVGLAIHIGTYALGGRGRAAA